MPKTSRTRLLLLSDTHTTPPAPQTFQTPYSHPLPPAQILLHAGDITKVGLRSEHTLMLETLKRHPAELKIIIAGNHDITLDQGYYNRVGWLRHRYRAPNQQDHLARLPKATQAGQQGGSGAGEGIEGAESPTEIKALYTCPAALACGIHYMEEETRTFTLPSTGANFTVHASPYTPEFCAWAFAYPRREDRFNPGPGTAGTAKSIVPSYPGVDILLTHGPPYGILDQVVGSGESVGCEHLYRAVERARPAVHVFGHIHEGYGARRVEWETSSSTSAPLAPQTGAAAGIKTVEEIHLDRETAMEERSAYVDLTSSSERSLRRGEETLFVNASVVNAEYKGLNAPWLVDLDLVVDQEMDTGA
ncbi:Metallo-dependent phosphatase-like protein [Aspergillus crustosus]